MNVENILKVADAIENRQIAWLGFNMRSWYAHKQDDEFGVPYKDNSGHNCGTVACIAGWASAVELGAEAFSKIITDTREDGRMLIGLNLLTSPEEYLGLSDGQRTSLFHGAHGDTSSDQAVRTLRHLAATGKVDWTV